MNTLAIAAIATMSCVLGASTAAAAPNGAWTGPKTVPKAITNDSPATSSISFPGANGQGQIVGWRGRGNQAPVSYTYRVIGIDKGKWSEPAHVTAGNVLGTTSSTPAFGSYRDPLGRLAILAVWTGHANEHIWYSQGETQADGKIDWTKPEFLPKTVTNASTTTGPAVLFTNHAYDVIIAWKGPANHIRFVVGQPKRRGFEWSDSEVVPGPPVGNNCHGSPCTGDTPALAELNTSATDGNIYFFWREFRTKAILYSTTDDDEANLLKPVFTGPVTVPGAASIEGPAASDTGLNGFGPLMLAYKVPIGLSVRFQTLTAGVWSAPAIVPHAETADAPALLFNQLAITTPAADGNIDLRDYK